MENIYLLDESFKEEYVVDVFESLIWTVRYKEAGEFELYTPISEDVLSKFAIGKYLLNDSFYSNNTAHLMVIETLELDQTHLKVTGRDLKSLLDRRVVWDRTEIAGETDIQTAIQTLINDAIIRPTLTQRKIDNFVLDLVNAEWPKTEEMVQYEGNSLLEVMNDFCTKYKVGYEVIYNFTDKKFHMHLIQPVNHSYDQLTNPPVVFSASFNNLKSSKYIESVSTYKNVAFVSGEHYQDDALNKFWITDIAGDNTLSGLARREAYIDASSEVHEQSNGDLRGDDPNPDGTYRQRLREYGRTELNKKDYRYIKDYEGEADNAASQYQFMRDYHIGDICEIVTVWGMSSMVRVSEVVLSMNTSGYTLVPTLEAIEEGD